MSASTTLKLGAGALLGATGRVSMAVTGELELSAAQNIVQLNCITVEDGVLVENAHLVQARASSVIRPGG